MIEKIKVGLVKRQDPGTRKERRERTHGTDFVFPTTNADSRGRRAVIEYEALATQTSAPPEKFAISAFKLCSLCARNESRVYGTLGSLWGMQVKHQHDEREN